MDVRAESMEVLVAEIHGLGYLPRRSARRGSHEYMLAGRLKEARRHSRLNDAQLAVLAQIPAYGARAETGDMLVAEIQGLGHPPRRNAPGGSHEYKLCCRLRLARPHLNDAQLAVLAQIPEYGGAPAVVDLLPAAKRQRLFSEVELADLGQIREDGAPANVRLAHSSGTAAHMPHVWVNEELR